MRALSSDHSRKAYVLFSFMELYEEPGWRAASPAAKELYIRLIGGIETCGLPGIGYMSIAQMASLMGWSSKKCSRVCEELAKNGTLFSNLAKSVYWLVPVLSMGSLPQNPKWVAGWCAALTNLPDCDVTRMATQAIGDLLYQKGGEHYQMFLQRSPYAHEPAANGDTVSGKSRYGISDSLAGGFSLASASDAVAFATQESSSNQSLPLGEAPHCDPAERDTGSTDAAVPLPAPAASGTSNVRRLCFTDKLEPDYDTLRRQNADLNAIVDGIEYPNVIAMADHVQRAVPCPPADVPAINLDTTPKADSTAPKALQDVPMKPPSPDLAPAPKNEPRPAERLPGMVHEGEAGYNPCSINNLGELANYLNHHFPHHVHSMHKPQIVERAKALFASSGPMDFNFVEKQRRALLADTRQQGKPQLYCTPSLLHRIETSLNIEKATLADQQAVKQEEQKESFCDTSKPTFVSSEGYYCHPADIVFMSACNPRLTFEKYDYDKHGECLRSGIVANAAKRA